MRAQGTALHLHTHTHISLPHFVSGSWFTYTAFPYTIDQPTHPHYISLLSPPLLLHPPISLHPPQSRSTPPTLTPPILTLTPSIPLSPHSPPLSPHPPSHHNTTHISVAGSHLDVILTGGPAMFSGVCGGCPSPPPLPCCCCLLAVVEAPRVSGG